MDKLSRKHFAKAKDAGRALNVAAKSMKVLSSVAWGSEQKERFLSDGKIPTPEYDPIDVSEPSRLITEARKSIEGEHVVFEWLGRLADTLETTTHLISSRGDTTFYEHSAALYGQPKKLMLDKKTRVIDLARHMDGTLEDLDFSKLVVEGYEAHLTAEEFANELSQKLAPHFGDKAPAVELSDTLSAKAVAGRRRIRVRSSASFTERDIEQLLQHEALIHTATALNGRSQPHFKILGRAHPGITEVQEGLAVFAEIISGAMDPQRFRRLSDRVIAIQMSIDGADFKEIFDFYNERLDDPDQSFENARRVFRGGVLTGGAPFTKDMVYLNGLLRVHNFMRTVVKLGRADLIRILFSGKMDIEDVPALAQMAASGRMRNPAFMPPWAKDLRFLVSYMAYSGFLNQVKMPGFQAYYKAELEDVPIVWAFGG
jgi:uncharacterized protein (TIGR02421 family)